MRRDRTAILTVPQQPLKACAFRKVLNFCGPEWARSKPLRADLRGGTQFAYLARVGRSYRATLNSSAKDPAMPEKETLRRAKKDKAEGKAPTTQAGEFIREEMDHIREGKHGARSTKQAIAIGLSKARRAGVKLRAPSRGKTSAKTRTQASRDSAKAASGT